MCKKINEQRERDRERGRKAERDNLYKCKEKCVWHRNRKLTTKITQYRLKCSNKKKKDFTNWWLLRLGIPHKCTNIHVSVHFCSVWFGSTRFGCCCCFLLLDVFCITQLKFKIVEHARSAPETRFENFYFQFDVFIALSSSSTH